MNPSCHGMALITSCRGQMQAQNQILVRGATIANMAALLLFASGQPWAWLQTPQGAEVKTVPAALPGPTALAAKDTACLACSHCLGG